MANARMIVDVEGNDEFGGCSIYEVVGQDGAVRFVCFSFDNGDSLGSVELVEKKDGGQFGGYELTGENLEDVYDEDDVEWLWSMEFDDEDDCEED